MQIGGTIRRLLSEYGMLGVLLGICVVLSLLTQAEQRPTGAGAAGRVVGVLPAGGGTGRRLLVVVRDQPDDVAFAEAVAQKAPARGWTVAGVVRGEPRDARRALLELTASGVGVEIIVCDPVAATWQVFSGMGQDFPLLARTRVVSPRSYRWPNFLKQENLLNVANQIAVIAIVAIGMTLVILTGGVDLSVGSLIALAAVLTALFIRDAAGGVQATAAGLTLACAVAVGACGMAGLLTGTLVTYAGIPPFIVTLAMMLVASGLAYILAGGESIYQVPDSFVWLGRGADLPGMPNAVVLTALLYGATHVLTTRTRLGRAIYAVGANSDAARLSGLPVHRIRLFVYAASGGLAGLGGVVLASQLKSGSPTYGQMYELYVIAAVVVGGASLSGGRGTLAGTLIGALTIAVIQNGMNLLGIESFTQKVVLGLVILGAVMVDRVRSRGE